MFGLVILRDFAYMPPIIALEMRIVEWPRLDDIPAEGVPFP